METNQPSPLGSLLLNTRKRADLTQEMLAERAAVSVNTISNLEAGRGHLPRQATLELLVSALATALALTPSEQMTLRATFKAAVAAMNARVPQAVSRPAVPAAPPHPTGILTFLTCALVPDAGRQVDQSTAIPRLAALLQRYVPPRGGLLLDPPDGPDGAVAIFTRKDDALAAAGALQQALAGDAVGAAMPVCLALHTGWAEPDVDEYSGPTRRRAVRLARLGHGGQVLLSQSSRDLVWRTRPEGARLREAGRYGLSVVERPQPIYQLVQAGTPAAFPPLRLSSTPPTNLPLQVTSFIGREREQATVEKLLARAPLVTLVGAGGCGKTRLALQVAADLLEEHPDGVWLVEFAALNQAASDNALLVPQVVATALSLREVPGQSFLETLLDALSTKRLLLILDNCEHLVAACAELAAALLRRCPRLRILATSRERLAIQGETSYRVPSLSLPEADQSHMAAWTGSEAVRLFAERAGAIKPAFALTEENGNAVVQICARLAGIPLAIELAAARVASMPVETIAKRLDQSIGLLTEGLRDMPPRQRTLRATLDWSWALLDQHEQALLQRLSVFAGGWSLGAAVAIRAGDEFADWEVPDLLDRLVNKSLVGLDEREPAIRYWLLETVRQYAGERLAASGTMAATRDRHLDWCLSFAEEAETHLKGPEQDAWLARLAREHDNLRAALAWARERGENDDRRPRLAGALWRFWHLRGYLTEGRGWLEEALISGGESPAGVRARVLDGAASLAYGQNDYARAGALHEEALALRRTLGDEQGIAASLNGLGNVAFQQDDYGRAVALYEEALALRRGLGDTWGIAASLGNLGNAADLQGDHGRATALIEEALALQREVGDTWGVATSLNNLGNIAGRLGDYERAAILLDEALLLFRTLGHTYGIARALDCRGDVACRQGEYGRAMALHDEALPLRRALGDTQGIAASLSGLGDVAYRLREDGRAMALYEEALALRRGLGDTWGVANSLQSLGLLAERQGEHERALALQRESFQLSHAIGSRDLTVKCLDCLARLAAAGGRQPLAARFAGAADALREALGLRLPAEERARQDRVIQQMRAALGETTFAAAWAEGRVMPLEQVDALARTCVYGPESGVPGASPRRRGRLGGPGGGGAGPA
ncbi:MAG TPA: tetratricopeptide repeat protein [Chloroflexota bacterium]|nr:tetratricopeptide repeat protein [Chloroflexota bacterium]